MECIDSVRNQSYTNWELILIDDGSTDNTIEIINSLSDSRVRLICAQHGGVSVARNLGLKQRTGDFCLFLDSDDTLEFYALKNISDFIKEYPDVEIIKFGYKTKERNFSASKEFCLSSSDFFKQGGLPTRTVWSNAYRSSLFDDIAFSPGIRVAEDTEVSIRCYFATRYLGQLTDVLYNYRTDEQSVMNSPVDIEKVRDHLRVINKLQQTVKPLDSIQEEAFSASIELLKISFFHALYHLPSSKSVSKLISEYRALPSTGKTKARALRFAEFSYKAYFFFLKYVRRVKQKG
jgi:glycosyltransferase involved in cell wall biosynthesis